MTITATRLLLAIFTLTLTACAATNHEAAPDSGPWIGAWNIQAIRGEPVDQENAPFIEWTDDGELSGHGGVNRFMGNWILAEDGTLGLTPLATTRKAGPPALMEQESELLDALTDVALARVNPRGELELVSEQGETLVVGTPREE